MTRRVPRVSVLTTVHDPDRDHLIACLRSVQDQESVEWEHVIVDDASTEPHVDEVLAAFAEDPRVRIIRRTDHGGVAAAANDAVAAAQGALIAFVDHDGQLAPGALAALSAAVTDDVDVAYSDHDRVLPDGRHVEPYFKPDFSPECLRGQNYISHLLMARRALVDDVGGFRSGVDGAHEHDLVLRLTERARQVAHVPAVLYHQRADTTGGEVPDAAASARVVAEHCARTGIDAQVTPTAEPGCLRVERRLGDRPLVSVVIPTRGSSGREWGATRTYVVDAIASMLERSTYRRLEFVVVHDTVTPPSVLHALHRVAGDDLTLVEFDGPFNFSEKINLGVGHAAGDHLLLLNDDTELIEPTSLDVMVGHLQMPDVAMVGARLLFADGTLQHGGHVYHHDVHHACDGWPGDSPGPLPFRPLAIERECSGVTAAAALVRRDAFEEVGGFSVDLPLNYNDVDFSLKIRRAGHRIIWTPWAAWYHFESRTRRAVVQEHETATLHERWGAEIRCDPYYNPNLTPLRSDWLELPPPGVLASLRPASWAERRQNTGGV